MRGIKPFRLWYLIAVVIWVMAAMVAPQPCGAGWGRFYRDQTVTSPNGRYRLEATSHANSPDGKRQGLISSDFAFKLIDQSNEAIVWEIGEGKLDMQPERVLVEDDGFAAVFDSRVLRLFKQQGQLLMQIDPLQDAIPEEQIKQYVERGLSGDYWTRLSRWYFFRVQGKPHFCIRTGWGLRIIADLESKKLVDDEGTVKETLDLEESNYVDSTLRYKALAELRKSPKSDARDGLLEQALTAANIAGQRKMRYIVPRLRLLEALPEFDVSCSDGRYRDFKKSEIDMIHYIVNPGRRVVQNAIRLTGEKPVGYAVVAFAMKREFPVQSSEDQMTAKIEAMKLITQPVDRAKTVSRLKKGMTAELVLEVAGPPDVVSDCWEYDIDDEHPYTLLIHWDADSCIVSTDTIRPARWEDGGRTQYHHGN